MSPERVNNWTYWPPAGSWFKIPARGGGESVIDVLWVGHEHADVTIDGVQKTIERQELTDLYHQATYVSLPRRIMRVGIDKNGRPTHPFQN